MGSKAIFTWAAGSIAWTNLGSGANQLHSMVISTDSTTLRRVIVDCFISTQSPLDGINYSGRVGLIVADQTVVTAGVAAIPKPLTDGDQEWLWNRGYANFIETVDATAPGQVPLHLHDDVRGMRKMKQGDNLVFVIENIAGASIRYVISVRALFSN